MPCRRGRSCSSRSGSSRPSSILGILSMNALDDLSARVVRDQQRLARERRGPRRGDHPRRPRGSLRRRRRARQPRAPGRAPRDLSPLTSVLQRLPPEPGRRDPLGGAARRASDDRLIAMPAAKEAIATGRRAASALTTLPSGAAAPLPLRSARGSRREDHGHRRREPRSRTAGLREPPAGRADRRESRDRSRRRRGRGRRDDGHGTRAEAPRRPRLPPAAPPRPAAVRRPRGDDVVAFAPLSPRSRGESSCANGRRDAFAAYVVPSSGCSP